MKLKNILIPFAGVLLLTACEKDHRNDNLTDPRVYIVNNGVQNAIYYDVEETIDYNIYAYSSGYFGQPSEVKVVPDPDAVEALNPAPPTGGAACSTTSATRPPFLSRPTPAAPPSPSASTARGSWRCPT